MELLTLIVFFLLIETSAVKATADAMTHGTSLGVAIGFAITALIMIIGVRHGHFINQRRYKQK